MSEYAGKICPFCMTQIQEAEAVKLCPDCGIAHHESCWEANHGCTTFGCTQQHYEQPNAAKALCAVCGEPLGDEQAFCTKCGTARTVAEEKKHLCSGCGAELAEGQAFCTRCGAPVVPATEAVVEEEKKNLCGKCGFELQEGQMFCPQCGQRAGLTVDSDVSSAISQFNQTVTKKKKKSKKLPIVLAVILLVCIAVGVVAMGAVNAKKAEEAVDQYMDDVQEFLDLALTAGANLEDIADTIQQYWHENIWEDKHGSDIDDAILYAMIDMSAEIEDAEDYDVTMRALYADIKKVPDNVPEEDADDLEEICDAVKELFNVYTDFYSLATDPSGSYNTYSEDNNDLTDEFLSCYRALDNLIN